MDPTEITPIALAVAAGLAGLWAVKTAIKIGVKAAMLPIKIGVFLSLIAVGAFIVTAG